MHWYFSSKLISGLLAAKCDSVRKGKMEKDIKKIDVRNLEIRATKPAAHNSNRELLSARRSVKRKAPVARSRSANRTENPKRMELNEDDVFSSYN